MPYSPICYISPFQFISGPLLTWADSYRQGTFVPVSKQVPSLGCLPKPLIGGSINIKGTTLSLRFSVSSAGTLTARLRAVSKLAHKTNTGSDIDAAHPRLRREFQRLRADLRSRTGQSPYSGLSGLPERDYFDLCLRQMGAGAAFKAKPFTPPKAKQAPRGRGRRAQT